MIMNQKRIKELQKISDNFWQINLKKKYGLKEELLITWLTFENFCIVRYI